MTKSAATAAVLEARAAAEHDVREAIMDATTIGDLVRIAEQLVRACGTDTPRLDADLIIGHVLELDRVALHVHADDALPAGLTDALVTAIARRVANEPVAYIIGHVGFRNLQLEVDERVLIPRGETELLVEWALEEIARRGAIDVVDACSGSGAVALAIADEAPGAVHVTSAELSAVALEVARENAERLGLDVRFVEADLLEPLLNEQFDVIVANPPYIKPTDASWMHPSVTWYEPDIALYADAGDEFAILRRLLRQALIVGRPGSLVATEIAAGTIDAVEAIFEQLGFEHIEHRDDLRGVERAVGGRVPGASS